MYFWQNNLVLRAKFPILNFLASLTLLKPRHFYDSTSCSMIYAKKEDQTEKFWERPNFIMKLWNIYYIRKYISSLKITKTKYCNLKSQLYLQLSPYSFTFGSTLPKTGRSAFPAVWLSKKQVPLCSTYFQNTEAINRSLNTYTEYCICLSIQQIYT